MAILPADNPVSEVLHPTGQDSMSASAASAAPEKPFAIVGIGASAGGLEAMTELLSSLPATSGMAFLLAQHLDPHHASMLVEILAKKPQCRFGRQPKARSSNRIICTSSRPTPACGFLKVA